MTICGCVGPQQHQLRCFVKTCASPTCAEPGAVQDAPFFTEKLKVQVLPCVILFLGGVAIDRIVGFEELGGKDDFREAALEQRLLTAGVVEAPQKGEDDSDGEEAEQLRIKLRQSLLSRRQSDDEDSDFD